MVPINVYAHFGLIGAVLAMSSKSGRAQLTLELISDDRKKLKVKSNFRNADEAIGIILGRILPPMVQNVKVRLQRGETEQFGGVGLFVFFFAGITGSFSWDRTPESPSLLHG